MTEQTSNDNSARILQAASESAYIRVNDQSPWLKIDAVADSRILALETVDYNDVHLEVSELDINKVEFMRLEKFDLKSKGE